MIDKKYIFGPILILIGLMLLGRGLGLFWFSFGDFSGFLLPVGLIVLGFWLITRIRQKEQRAQSDDREFTTGRPTSDSGKVGTESGSAGFQPRHFSEQPAFSAPGKVKYSKVFGDIFIDCAEVELQSVEVSTVFGDAEVKLHGGKLGKGLNRLVISGFIGDVRILVPDDMPVHTQCSNFIGDLEILGRRTSGFGNNIASETGSYANADSKLFIATNNFIGDVRIYVV